MSDRHVRPVDDGWSVYRTDGARAGAHTATRADAVTRAVEIVANDGGGNVLVHGADDAVLETREVPAGATDTGRIATELAASSTLTSTQETAREVGDELGETADEVAAETSTAAKKVAGHTRTGAEHAGATAAAAAEGLGDEVGKVRSGDKSVRAAGRDAAAIASTTGEQISEQADRTAREVSGEARASARRSAAVVEEQAQETTEELAAAADRASRVGARAERELRTVADRTGRSIHDVTEAVAIPLDRVAAVLNPVRVTGRVLGAVATGGLRLVGRVTTRSTNAARRGTADLARR